MKAKMINECHIEGLLYESKLEMKVTGEKSKNPGTTFITGTIDIATNDACNNIVPVHFTYVTEKTTKGNVNATFTTLKNIVDGNIKSIIADGKDNAGRLRIDSAIGLNDFYTKDRETNDIVLVSAKRNEGGFVHTANELSSDEKTRNTFKCDMVIVGTKRIEANEEFNTPEKLIIKGYIFDVRKAAMPVESKRNELF